MRILGLDPFQLLTNQQGQIGAPLTAEAAAGADSLDVPQRSVVIGEPIPVVFCRRVGNTGGVLISPPAAECRFENDASNNVTARYRLVLGEGQMDGIQVRDVFQRSCRVGSFSQTFERRAGDWLPGNFIVERAGYQKPEASYYCGTGGTYEKLTVASFEITVPDGSDQWNRQVHFFIRGGMFVERLIDGIYGPSNNIADLALWALSNPGRVDPDLIDTSRFLPGALFTEAMGFRCDVNLREVRSIENFLADHLKYFLLTKHRRGGRLGLRPLLPVGDDNLISTEPVEPLFVFDGDQIVPGSLEWNDVPRAVRRPKCLLMMWRQQPDDDIGLVRTTEVRYAGTALDGPYHQHDLSAFCTNELHAVRAGAYIVARDWHVTHTLRVKLKPGDFNATIARGHIIQLQFTRWASVAAPSQHSYFYEVEQVRRARNGEVSLELTHFPVDDEGRSLVALDVMAAEASGIMLPTAKIAAVTCDTNSATDRNVPNDVSLDPIDWENTPYADAFDPADNGTGTGGFGGGGTGGRGGTWGGRGDGGGTPGDRSPDTPPPPGTPAGPYSPPDTQTPPPDVTVPPADVPVGQPAPKRWVDEYNRRVGNSTYDTPWPTDWGDDNRAWSLVYRVTVYQAEARYINGSGAVPGPYTYDWSFNSVSTGYWVYGGNVSTSVLGDRVDVYQPRVEFGPDPLSVAVYGGGLEYWFRTDRPYFIDWVIFPKAPIIRLVSATRTA